MSGFKNPYDPNINLSRGCGCGRHTTQAEHDAAVETDQLASGSEALQARVVESAVMRALCPQDELRRRFLRAVGAGTALSAISTFFPLGMAKEAFAQVGNLEKQSVKIGFIPITCATPITQLQSHTATCPVRARRIVFHSQHAYALVDLIWRKSGGLAALVRAVELLAVGQRPAVVDLDAVAGLGTGAGAVAEMGDLDAGRQ